MPLLNGARVVAAISTLGAIGAHAWLSPDTGGLRWATLAALATGIVGGGLWRRGTEAIVLGLAHVWPLAVFGVTGRVDANTVAIWMAALLGLALAGSPIDRWSLPPAWRVPVSAWALVLALGWPIVLWRELDFTLVTYGQADVPNGMLSAPARLAAQAATGMTMAQLTALLVMDWLHYRVRAVRGVLGVREGRGIQHPAYQSPPNHANPKNPKKPANPNPKNPANVENLENPTELRPFLREVVLPLTAGTVVAMLVGLYQGLVDLSWMSVEPWPRLGRAAGAFFDANAFGAVSALWGALVAGVCLVIGTARLRWAGAMLLALSAAAVWVSGSRTAFVGWLIVSGGLGLSLARIGRVSRTVAMAGGGLLAAAIVAGALIGGPGTAVQRLVQTLPRPTVDGALSFARAMWDRDGYGVASMRIVREFPATGVGPGAFHVLAPDYAYLTTGRLLPADNAQNWWRHMWTELGLLGSVPPIVCSVLVVVALVRLARKGPEDALAPLVGSGVAALGLMAFVGPPMLHPIVLQTAAVMLFWVICLADRGRDGPAEPTARVSTPAFVLVFVWLLPTVWAGLTLMLAVTELRPPYRAHHIGWVYSYGFSPPESVSGGERRWATTRAVGVIPAAGTRLTLTLEPPHADISARPVRVRVSDRHTVVSDTRRATREPFDCVVSVAPDQRWVMVQIDTNRAWTTHAGMPWAMRVTARWE